jgi:glycosyltransferase domain-containing protein
VPTHNRHYYLQRSIAYFSVFNAEVIFVDSSSKPYLGKLTPNIKYIHCPEMSFYKKALFAINKSKTEFIAFCADDDFLIEESLNIGKSRLEENKNLTASVGRYLGFDETFNGEIYKIQNYAAWPDVETVPRQNIVNFMSNYHQILWAIYRKDTIRNAYEIIEEANFSNDNFIELVIATLCCGTGGIALIDDFWGVREIANGDHWGKRHSALHSAQNTEIFINDVQKFTSLLDPFIGDGNAKLAIDCYLKSSELKTNRTLLRRTKILIHKFLNVLKLNISRDTVTHPTLVPIIKAIKRV